MPGWGDEIDLVSNLKTVVTFLLEQRKKDLLENKVGSTGGGHNLQNVVLYRLIGCCGLGSQHCASH